MAPDLDLSMLLHAFDGNAENVALVLAAAISSIERDAVRIEDAAARCDTKLALEATHRLKGTCGTIRAARLFEIGTTMEREARTPPGSIAPSLIAEMHEAAAALQREISSYGTGLDLPRPAGAGAVD